MFLFNTSSNVSLNAGKIAAIDEPGMEHDSDDSNAIHIKMKVTCCLVLYILNLNFSNLGEVGR